MFEHNGFGRAPALITSKTTLSVQPMKTSGYGVKCTFYGQKAIKWPFLTLSVAAFMVILYRPYSWRLAALLMQIGKKV